ncbi:MAG: outer membrane beta-barrel protein, partial [Saprospiraceae bacterium]|nr:outer membrane beta-barrel protein [Saprospiraceae bacterium]
MKKTVLLVCSAFFTLQVSFGQVAVGLKTGVNFNSAQTTDLLDQATPDFKFTPGWNAGLVTEINFGKYFAIQPEVNWIQKGFSWNESAGVPIGNVEIPIGA